MSALPRPTLAPAAFFAWEAEQVEKHEYYYGEVFAMAGGTPEHALLGMNVGAQLVARLAGGPCRVFSSDLAVELDPSGRFCYPDVTVVCGAVERSAHGPAVANPALVVEVLSAHTAAYDRGGKAEAYRRLPSLRAIVFVESTRVGVDALVREGDRWLVAEPDADGRLALDAVGADLDVPALYDGLDLPADGRPTSQT
jgi:Uma2 family endonuclease